jgi:hypothetical protein
MLDLTAGLHQLGKAFAGTSGAKAPGFVDVMSRLKPPTNPFNSQKSARIARTELKGTRERHPDDFGVDAVRRENPTT